MDEIIKKHNELCAQRQTTNIEIAKLLLDYLERNPHERFIQALWNLNIVDKSDRFSEESVITLSKIKRQLEMHEEMKRNMYAKRGSEEETNSVDKGE